MVRKMIGYPQEQRSLNKEQKETMGLLSIGTFLEYFDLMIYVHMAVFLNGLFFPQLIRTLLLCILQVLFVQPTYLDH